MFPKGNFYTSDTLAFMSSASVFGSATQGIPLDHLALMARGLKFLGLRELCQMERQFLEGFHFQGTAQTADWGTLPSLSM